MAARKTFCLLLVVVVTTVASATASGNAPAGGKKAEFIRTSCGATLYPNVCFTSLAGYASKVQEDPVQLARLAANVSLARVLAVSAHVSSLSRGSAAGADKRVAAALRDCADVLGAAADKTRQSAAELGRLAAAVGTEVAWRVSNAQTWMSAALTNEDTCADGFEGVGSVTVKADVCGRVGRAKQFTSNALALVNHIVTSH